MAFLLEDKHTTGSLATDQSLATLDKQSNLLEFKAARAYPDFHLVNTGFSEWLKVVSFWEKGWSNPVLISGIRVDLHL